MEEGTNTQHLQKINLATMTVEAEQTFLANGLGAEISPDGDTVAVFVKGNQTLTPPAGDRLWVLDFDSWEVIGSNDALTTLLWSHGWEELPPEDPGLFSLFSPTLIISLVFSARHYGWKYLKRKTN
jgi:hypothetical protein